MAYIINKTDGTVLTVILDNQQDDTSTSLTLFGKGFKDWGEKINENFIKLLENFSNSTAPANPLNGQLWYDSLNQKLKIYNEVSNEWKTLFLADNTLSFYNQTINTISANVTGFINEHDIIGLFTNTFVSASLLDNGTLYPNSNAQSDFPNGIEQGLNLSLNNSKIYGQNNLLLGNIISPGVINDSILVSSNGSVKINYSLQIINATESNQIKVSSSEVFNPTYSLPVSSGNLNQILVSQGNNNNLVWKNISDITNVNDRITGFSSTANFNAVVASSISFSGIEFYTQNNLRAVVDKDGNFGLGISSAKYLLHLEPNTSSQNSFIGIRNSNPVKETGIEIVYEVDTGDNPKINFVRTNSSNGPTFTNETIGSLNWYGKNGSNNLNKIAELRTVSLSADISGISGTIEFLISDGSGTSNKILEINKDSEITIYYSAESNYYTLPSSAGNEGDVLISKGENNKLSWRPQENYKVLLTAFSIFGMSETPSISLSTSADAKYEFIVSRFSVSNNCTISLMNYREGGGNDGNFDGMLTKRHLNGSTVFLSSHPIGFDLVTTGAGSHIISAGKTYNFKALIERDPILINAINIVAEIYESSGTFEVDARGRTGTGTGFDFVVTALGFGITTTGTFTAGSARFYKIENPTPNFKL